MDKIIYDMEVIYDVEKDLCIKTQRSAQQNTAMGMQTMLGINQQIPAADNRNDELLLLLEDQT